MYKLLSTLSTICEVFGDREVVLARELTKIHEEFIRGKISDVLNQMDEPKGEFVILVEGNNISKKDKELKNLSELNIEEHYNYYEKQGLEKKEIIKKVAKDRNLSKNEVYQIFLKK